MKQVLAVRVGAKKAVGHIVSKKWGPTVGGLGSEARFQVKKKCLFLVPWKISRMMRF